MMNLQWIVTASSLIMGMVSAAHDDTTNSLRVQWNENQFDIVGKCNDMDWKLIDEILASAKMVEDYDETKHLAEDMFTSGGEDELGLNKAQALPPVRRYLRSKVERILPTQSECKSLCAGYVSGYCPKPGCVGYNQNIEVVPLDDSTTTKTEPQTTSAPDDTRARKLEYANDIKMTTTPCGEEQTKFINNKFNQLIRNDAVTSSCRAFLKDSRHVVCYRRNDDFNELNTGMFM